MSVVEELKQLSPSKIRQLIIEIPNVANNQKISFRFNP